MTKRAFSTQNLVGMTLAEIDPVKDKEYKRNKIFGDNSYLDST